MSYSAIQQAVSDQKALFAAADALRRFEMKGRILLPWDQISSSQQRKWCEKARIVLDAAHVFPIG